MSIKFEDYDDYGLVHSEDSLSAVNHSEATVFLPNEANGASSSPVFRIREEPDVKFRGNDCSFPLQGCDYDVNQLLDVHSASMKEQAYALLQNEDLSLITLGEVVANHDCSSEYQELFSNKLKEVRLDLIEARALQLASSQLPSSSDPLVSQLSAIVQNQSNLITGLSFVINALLINQQELRQELHRANNRIIKPAERLPENARLHGSNLTRQWIVPALPPFKRVNLNDLLDKWKRSPRSREDDHLVHCIDFLRNYLIRACEPVERIQTYACRQTGKCGKHERLLDVPEEIVDILINCLLDGFGLGHPELSMTADQLIARPTRYWKELGPIDAIRTVALEERRKARVEWGPQIRASLGKALADVRAYVMKQDRLVPPQKRKALEPLGEAKSQAPVRQPEQPQASPPIRL
ncbi:hypothetical protein RB195_006937 [Necator americanus]|uniref:Uncharacterized protein n=1 Tax=Necator americanus TaxID=51031 RepID=A0ABR1BXG4_NECAM